MPTIDSKIVSARVSNKTARELEKIAEEKGKTASGIIGELIEEMVNGNDEEVDALEYEGVLLIRRLRERHSDDEIMKWLQEV